MRAPVIAIACELPSDRGLALSRHFASSIWQVVTGEGVQISLRSVQRILRANALKPWRYMSWMHPRDPDFVTKVKVILDLYQFIFEGKSLGPDDHVLCADEKTSIQARQRQVTAPGPGEPGRPGKPGHIESDYKRAGALQYLAAWDVRYPNLILIHTPVHASWVNQVEIYFSILQRKVLTPAVSASLAKLAERILAFEVTMRGRPKAINWQFSSADFDRKPAELADAMPLAA